jgi:hypothetical protein
MTVRYEYKSVCCGHEYIEQRGSTEPQIITICNDCGNADYELINETVLSEEVERSPGPEAPTE